MSFFLVALWIQSLFYRSHRVDARLMCFICFKQKCIAYLCGCANKRRRNWNHIDYMLFIRQKVHQNSWCMFDSGPFSTHNAFDTIQQQMENSISNCHEQFSNWKKKMWISWKIRSSCNTTRSWDVNRCVVSPQVNSRTSCTSIQTGIHPSEVCFKWHADKTSHMAGCRKLKNKYHSRSTARVFWFCLLQRWQWRGLCSLVWF